MTSSEPSAHIMLNCLNCGAMLAGRYRSNCGQKDDPH